jgi:hypothetical protein
MRTEVDIPTMSERDRSTSPLRWDDIPSFS